MNFFTLFELPQVYKIDNEVLESQYLATQTKFHPDKFINNDAKKMEALELLLKVNEAYKILKSDLLRAEYILSLNGVNSTETIAKETVLSEALEDRDALECARNDQLQSLYENAKLEFRHLTELFNDCYQADLLQAAEIALRMRYKEKFIKDIKNRVEE